MLYYNNLIKNNHKVLKFVFILININIIVLEEFSKYIEVSFCYYLISCGWIRYVLILKIGFKIRHKIPHNILLFGYTIKISKIRIPIFFFHNHEIKHFNENRINYNFLRAIFRGGYK